jgi:hypothetical protein
MDASVPEWKDLLTPQMKKRLIDASDIHQTIVLAFHLSEDA